MYLWCRVIVGLFGYCLCRILFVVYCVFVLFVMVCGVLAWLVLLVFACEV